MALDNVFAGKSIFVTGGTGSFGHFIVKELLRFDVEEVVVFSRDEEKQLDMRREFPDPRLKFVIGDVRDIERVDKCIRADYIYHAAALKVIPTCEEFPTEAIKTNVIGTLNVKKACIANEVEKAIFVSTDKAVKPVNAYGMTKALSEKIWLESQSSKTVFSVVRYGNVLGSRGSVVPYFRKLISQGKPLPITSTSMSRFILTLRQAIDLVFYATENMKGGEIFIPNNPACLIVDLAEAMVSGGYPRQVVGIRPGEKIHEVLISEEEIRRTEAKEDCFIIHPHGRYVNASMESEFTSETARQLDIEEIRNLLEDAEV